MPYRITYPPPASHGLEFVVQHEGEEPGEEVGYAVDFEEAREAADLHAIIQDISFVTQVCDRLEDQLLAQEANAKRKTSALP